MCLSRIQSLRLAAILEDSSYQLDILGHTLQISRERGAAAAQEKTRLAQLTRDCQYISELMVTLHLELEEKQSFSSLLQAMEDVEQKKDQNMKREAMRELEKRKQTLKQHEELQHKAPKVKQDACSHHTDLTAAKHEHLSQIISEKNTEVQLKKIQKETSHAEMLLENQLELLQKQLKEEERVHDESQKFLLNQHKELQQLLHGWLQSTEQMVHEKKEEIKNTCLKKTQKSDRLTEMRRKYKEMEQVVIEYREEQEKLRQMEVRTRAATKLQAWWRDCMVRRGLGRFKKAEKGKKKKKEGKKKRK